MGKTLPNNVEQITGIYKRYDAQNVEKYLDTGTHLIIIIITRGKGEQVLSYFII
jgi:hypothetical protein